MTMQCTRPKTPCVLLLVAMAGLAMSACNGASVEETPPPGQPGDMMPVGTNPGNMTGNMNPNGSNNGKGRASLKFCNGVSKPGSPLEMELVIGSMKWKAAAGTCSPGDCSMVDAGVARLVFNLDGKEVFAQDVAIEAGQQYVVISTVDKASQKVGLSGGKLRSGASCASENPFPAGSSPGPVATAGKFCHGLSVGTQGDPNGGQPASMELTVGGVTMVAETGGCSSATGAMCPALPVGMTTAKLVYDGQEIATAAVNIESGREYLFGLTLNAAMRPVIVSQVLDGSVSCASATRGNGPGPGTMPPPGGGGTMAEVKFCNRLPASGAGNEATLEINGTVALTAKPGQCAPLKGMACSMVPAGATNFALSINGMDAGETDDVLSAGATILSLVPAGAGQLKLNIGAVPAGMTCSAFEPM
jgi:hypothetical protein